MGTFKDQSQFQNSAWWESVTEISSLSVEGVWIDPWLPAVLARIQPRCVLDVGCADGRASAWIANQYTGARSIKVVGLDGDFGGIADAHRRFGGDGAAADRSDRRALVYRHGTIGGRARWWLGPEFESGFDLVCAFSVHPQQRRYQSYWSEIASLLAPGATLIALGESKSRGGLEPLHLNLASDILQAEGVGVQMAGSVHRKIAGVGADPHPLHGLIAHKPREVCGAPGFGDGIFLFMPADDPALFEGCTQFRDAWLRRPVGLRYRPGEIPYEQDCHHFVAFRAGAMVGMCMIHRRDAQHYQLMQMAVHPDVQGQGIGQDLVQAAVEHVTDVYILSGHPSGETWLTLDARLQAVPFYKRCGFEVVGAQYLKLGIEHHRMRQRVGLNGG